MKKFISFLLAVLLGVGSLIVPVSAATTEFSDINTDNKVLAQAVDLLNYMGVAKGISDTEFGANELVTREQFALFVYRLMKGGKDAPINASNTTKFTDLVDPTYNYAISWAVAEGIVNGKSETSFAPKDGITLQEAYTMVVRALDYEEEEKLIYPHGYIEVAEKLGVELDANLDSKLGYEDTLTRADMAIILYNAFFAETGVAEVKTRERGLGLIDDKGTADKDDDVYTNYVIEEYTVYPRLCEKFFEVYEVEYQVLATPNFQVAGASEATYELGYPAIYVEATDADVNAEVDKLPASAYIEAEDLGLEAEALNDLFLGYIKMFVTLEEKNNVNEIDKVLFFDCDMVEKTVNDLKLETVAADKADSYFTGSKAKLLTGKMTTGTETIYAYNAPYSYTKPETDSSTYKAKNEDNIKKISFTKFEDDDVVYYEATLGDYLVGALNTEATDNYKAAAEELIKELEQVYYGGLYEADLYDIDGNGIYDYIQYKPYSLFVVDSDEDYSFLDYNDMADVTSKTEANSGEALPYVYTNEATITGVEFKDEDVVIGYYNTDADLVHVAAVLKPTVSTVKTYKSSKGTITLSNGDVIDAVSAWKYVANYSTITNDIVVDAKDELNAQVAASPLFTPAILDNNDEIEFYVYNDVLLYYTAVDEVSKFSGNLIIPNNNKPINEVFSPELGNTFTYINVYVDGKEKYVPIETKDIYPAIIVDDKVSEDYAEQLCTYTVKDGLYIISSLAFGKDEDGAPDCLSSEVSVLNSDKPADYIAYNKTDVSMTKVAGSRFTLGDETRKVELQNYTNIIIRVPGDKDGEYEYLTYGKSDFTASAETVFDTATYILTNNVNSNTKENLAVLYATVSDDFEFVGKSNKKGYRIVCESEFAINDDGEFRNFYTLINPFTGEKEYNVPSKYSANKAKDIIDPVENGVIVKLVNGFVDEDKETAELDNAVWVTEYDDALNLAPITDTACETCIEATADTFVEVDKNTVVMVLKADSEDKLFTEGELSIVDAKVLENQKNDYFCSNKVEDRNGNLKYRYAPYVKAYVSYDTDVDEDETYVADYVIIVVYENDELITNEDCKICK